jgi:hypothetical protein
VPGHRAVDGRKLSWTAETAFRLPAGKVIRVLDNADVPL